MTEEYQVQLERPRDANGQLGSFGLSILGGYGTKFPAVVCEVDPGGPADRTNLVKVGDKLTNLNGEDLRELTPKDLVNKIRTAPSSSTFTLLKDEELRQQVIALLRKQERRAAIRKERASASGEGPGDGKPVKKTSIGGPLGQEERKKKIMSKIIEVEPSVNVKGSGEIVQVYHNQIIGIRKMDNELENERELSPRRGGRQTPPRDTSPQISNGSEGREGALIPKHAPQKTSTSPNSQASPSPEHITTSTPAQNITPNGTPHTSSHDSTGLRSTELESNATTECDSGGAVQIPKWSGPVNGDNRASLSEAVLIDEIERTSKATPTDEGTKEQGEEPRAQSVDSQSSSSSQQSPGKGRAPLVDEHKKEELMKMYRNSPNRSHPSKKDDPYTMAVSLARRLYMLDGFKKSEIAQKLADPSEFGLIVAKEYLKFFEFEGLSLDESLRQFLSSFMLTGESQERERVMVHFSDRYFSANPDVFPNSDSVHGLTVALLLLNTDLHTDHGRSKMSFAHFVTNLGGIDVKLPRDVLKKYYNNIRKRPLEWAVDDEEELLDSNHSDELLDEEAVRVYHVTIPGTFVEVELSDNAPLLKEGFVLRKNIMEGPHKKVQRGKRNWRPYYAYLKGFLLYFGEPQGELQLEDTSGAITVCHCLAMGAFDYNKKNSVLRVTTSDWHSFLLQANDVTDMQQWIGAINKASALYSSAPLPAPMSSSATFSRPTFPLAPTKNTIDQQVESHVARIKSLEKEMEEHQAYKPTGSKAKHNLLQVWFDKYEFLQYQMNCYRIYYASLTSSELVNFNAPLPSGLVPSPSVSTLAVTGTSHDLDLNVRSPHSPSSYRKSSHLDLRGAVQSSSPLASGRGKRS
ncbi:PH and SEC7 domain-containing protein 1-like isoform X2 [Halichondria panicea]